MRTTLTLEPDIIRLIEEEVHRRRSTFKDVVNDAIRRGLAPKNVTSRRPKVRVESHDARLNPGLDPGSLNRLADELEDEAVVAKARARRKAR
jgi:hypothetical protein